MKKTQLLICLLVYCIPNIVLSQPSNDRHELIRQFVTFDAIYNKIRKRIVWILVILLLLGFSVFHIYNK